MITSSRTAIYPNIALSCHSFSDQKSKESNGKKLQEKIQQLERKQNEVNRQREKILYLEKEFNDFVQSNNNKINQLENYHSHYVSVCNEIIIQHSDMFNKITYLENIFNDFIWSFNQTGNNINTVPVYLQQ